MTHASDTYPSFPSSITELTDRLSTRLDNAPPPVSRQAQMLLALRPLVPRVQMMLGDGYRLGEIAAVLSDGEYKVTTNMLRVLMNRTDAPSSPDACSEEAGDAGHEGPHGDAQTGAVFTHAPDQHEKPAATPSLTPAP